MKYGMILSSGTLGRFRAQSTVYDDVNRDLVIVNTVHNATRVAISYMPSICNATLHLVVQSIIALPTCS
jgi:hypothetical protein